MIIVGTAGHIDHGKSSVVRRLTGTDPDRLPEEKARGMTIDLGFAFMDSGQENIVAFVDVPGHERFVKNMIAGAGGIDAVMLVVAADDGWMPQSQEHFQVVRLLGVTQGLIVINKIDLVEPDWLELLQADIAEKVQGSFLESAPVYPVSAQTGEGFAPLTEHLRDLSTRLASKKDIGKARLAIDRSFVRPGIGGVVTGTLRGGSFSIGQNVAVWPSMKQGKIRSLQSNNIDVETARPGQRTAVGFTGIDKEHLTRGGVVSSRTDFDHFLTNPVLALSIELVPESIIALEDRRRLLLISGTTEVEGEVRILNADRILPGQSGIVFFKPDEPMYTLVGDHFIVRLPTPMVTVGGGTILDHLPHYPRRKMYPSFGYLNQRVTGDVTDLVRSELAKRSFMPADTVLEEADLSRGRVRDTVARLADEGVLARHGKFVYDVTSVGAEAGGLLKKIEAYLAENSHLKGITPEQVRGLIRMPGEIVTFLLDILIARGQLVKVGDTLNLVGRGMSLKGEIKTAHDEIMRELRADPYSPPALPKLAARGKSFREAIRFVIESGEGYKCGSEFVFLTETWNEVTAFIRDYLAEHGELKVTELRDRFGFTRKFAIPILEETDRLGLTERDGDSRIKGEKFEA